MTPDAGGELRAALATVNAVDLALVRAIGRDDPANLLRSVRPEPHRVRRQIGARIAKLRAQRQISQEQLGLEVGLARMAMTRLENGKRGLDLERLGSIAKVLDAPIASLLWAPPHATPPSAAALDPNRPRTIGRRIVELRAECGVSRGQLAQAGGIGFHTFRRVETGARGLQVDEFIAIVEVFERIPRITPHLIDDLRQVRDLLNRLLTEAEST